MPEPASASAGPTADGLTIIAGSSTLKGLVINRFRGNGISIQINGQNVVQGNYIGTDETGTVAMGNSGSGISIRDSPSNVIGGATATSSGNLISGNGSGIFIFGNFSSGNIIQGNLIGSNINGNTDLGNTDGVSIVNAVNNTIGGSNADSRNIISGNQNSEVDISGTGNLVRGNFIRTNKLGSARLSLDPGGYGVSITGNNNSIGGVSIAERNIISGHEREVTISFCSGNQVQANYIGTDVTGSVPLGGDSQYGVGRYMD